MRGAALPRRMLHELSKTEMLPVPAPCVFSVSFFSCHGERVAAPRAQSQLKQDEPHMSQHGETPMPTNS